MNDRPDYDGAVAFPNGHRIHMMCRGGGPPLLLIMGLGSNCDMWEPLLPYLDGRLVIGFDAPGTGRSSCPSHPVSVPALADIAADVMKHFHVTQADVLGFSYGGAVAQQLAVQHPARVRRMILAATTMGAGSVPGDRNASKELASPLRFYQPDRFERTAAAVYGGRVGRDPQTRHQLAITRSKHPPSPYGYALQLMGGWAWTSRRIAGLIEQPTMVLSGDDDPLVPLENARALAAAIPNSTLHIMPGAGHLLLLDEAPDVSKIITEFLDAP